MINCPTWRKVMILCLILNKISCQEYDENGANFLHSMMDEIQREKFKSSLNILANHLFIDKSDPTTTSNINPDVKDLIFRIVSPYRNSPDNIEEEPPYPDPGVVREEYIDDQQYQHDDSYQPQPYQQDQQQQQQTQNSNLPLSKDELLALYQAAINKGASLNISSLPSLADNGIDISNSVDHGTLPGYYYYFYPIKNLMSNDGQQMDGDSMNGMMSMQGQEMNMQGGAPVKRLEPLFIAMASFVSVAMMFILSILFMPKFGNVRSDVAAVKEVTEEGDLSYLSDIVFEAIDGRDCSERLACELGQAIRVMKLGSKPIRAIEIFLPPNLAKQLASVRKSSVKRERCSFIPCRDKPLKKPGIIIKKPAITILSSSASSVPAKT